MRSGAPRGGGGSGAPVVAGRLRFSSDAAPGIRRRRAGRGFRFIDASGEPVRAPAELARLRALAVPPAWGDVWLCPDPYGHIQATGRDARGRKQYRYHPAWVAHRSARKYERLAAFAQALPALRSRVNADLGAPGLPRRKVLAALVALLEATCIRIGNEEYARANGTHGLSTLRDRHVRVEGARIRFSFRGKSGKAHRLDLHDRRLAAVVRRCRDLDGQELFQYIAEAGDVQRVTAADVNAYLREAMGEDFTAKDVRTWSGTVYCAGLLAALPPPAGPPEAARVIARAVRETAAHLGNTAAVCRASYIHPAVLAAYEDGRLAHAQVRAVEGLHPEEQLTLAVIAGNA